MLGRSILSLSSSSSLQVQHRLLSVPFYIYPELLMLGDRLTDGNGDPFSYKGMEEYVNGGRVAQPIKHSDDHYFAAQAANHPMRTDDPPKAKLILVPVLVNAVAEAMCYGVVSTRSVCWTTLTSMNTMTNTNTTKLCDLDPLLEAERVLSGSAWFHWSGGRDHLIVGGHWYVNRLLWADDHFPPSSSLRQTGTNTFEGLQFSSNLTGRYTLPSMYVGEGCPDSPSGKTHDFAFIGSINGRFLVRYRLCHRLSSMNTSVSTCGEGPKCPALSRARFGFHVKGDTFGANCPLDTLLSGTIPIFTHPDQNKILPPFVDWASMTYFYEFGDNGKDSASWLKQGLDKIVNDTLGYESRMDAIQRNRDLFDYETNVPFELYMFGFQCYLYPETCNTEDPAVHHFQSRYPALRLPTGTTAL